MRKIPILALCGVVLLILLTGCSSDHATSAPALAMASSADSSAASRCKTPEKEKKQKKVHRHFTDGEIHGVRARRFDTADLPLPQGAGTGKRALVLYDSTGTWGWMGVLYSQHLQNLLNHFRANVTVLPVEKYKAHDIQRYDITFYIADLYGNPTPQSFFDDVMTSTKPVCWMGSNLWKIAWTPDYAAYNASFEAKFGIRYLGLDTATGYSSVQYKGQSLIKQAYDPSLNLVQVLDSSLATTPATAQSNSGSSSPYIVHAANLWYVADNPFVYVTTGDRQLAFADLLHDMLGSTQGVVHRAFIRIEDVSPIVPAQTIRDITDYLYSQGVPFGICVIPEYRDPLGTYNNGVATTIDMKDVPDFVAALKYATTRGGQIIMHGYTHQYSNVLNPYSGVTAEDFEFYRVTQDSAGKQILNGPVPEDSKAWALGRLNTGLRLLNEQHLSPVAWNTVHYLASPEDYKAFAQKFSLSVDRGLYFANGSDGTLYLLQQTLPYDIPYDQFGMARIPENVGYVDPDGADGNVPTLPADLVARANANLVVRDGWAGCYFHWFLDQSYLQQLVTGIKGLGYKFVPLPTN